MVVLLLGLMGFILGLAYRQEGLRVLEAEVQKLRVQDRGVTLVDLLAKAPIVDRTQQARAWGLFSHSAVEWKVPSKLISGLET